MTPDEYRRKHKRCGMCEYWLTLYGFKAPEAELCMAGECKVKGTLTKATSGRFCRVYEAKPFEDYEDEDYEDEDY